MATLSREQKMINDLTLELGNLKRDYTVVVESLEQLSRRVYPVCHEHGNNSRDMAYLRGQVRDSRFLLGEIEENRPELYPYKR